MAVLNPANCGLWGDYAKERDEARAWLAEAKEQNPKSYLAGEVGSAFVPGLGAANAIGKGARLAGKGIDVGSDLVKAAGAGALETGLATVGAAESLDDLSARNLATNVGMRRRRWRGHQCCNRAWRQGLGQAG